MGSAIREGDYKLIKRYDDDSIELYDLATDLGERKNLANASPEMAQKLKSKLDDWLRDSHAKMPVRIAPGQN